MDARLLEALPEFTIDGITQWVKVAAHVGGGMTNIQCFQRYRRKLDPALQLLNNEPWTEGESQQLKELVQQQQNSSVFKTIDWVSIGSELNRNPRRCQNRWNCVQACLRTKSLQKGHFDDEMDARLLEALPEFTIDGKTNWVEVAAHVGGGMTNAQCHKRYRYKLDPALQLLNNDPWTEAESEWLEELVEQQQQEQQQQEQQQNSSLGDKIDWKPIGIALNRSHKKCQIKWYNSQAFLLAKSLKTGPFAPEEDKIIMERVAAVGTEEKGLWRGLETELGRPAKNINSRWRRHLSKR
ncbi:hypothetical protein B484DRAFT_441369 [Ochromonadaceae sp. CCMP2298]|nr:hypothetical protein B484DRAFT_441369 [Ochromonadaceae sp. CCMP2298]